MKSRILLFQLFFLFFIYSAQAQSTSQFSASAGFGIINNNYSFFDNSPFLVDSNVTDLQSKDYFYPMISNLNFYIPSKRYRFSYVFGVWFQLPKKNDTCFYNNPYISSQYTQGGGINLGLSTSVGKEFIGLNLLAGLSYILYSSRVDLYSYGPSSVRTYHNSHISHFGPYADVGIYLKYRQLALLPSFHTFLSVENNQILAAYGGLISLRYYFKNTE